MKREEMVMRLIAQKYNWVVGGFENEILDGERDQMPTQQTIEEHIYDEVMDADGLEVGFNIFPIKKDIRFLGTEKIKKMINEFYNKKNK